MALRSKLFWSLLWAFQNITFTFAVVRSWPLTDHPLTGNWKIEINDNQSLIGFHISNSLILTCSFLFAQREINFLFLRKMGKLPKGVLLLEVAVVLFVFLGFVTVGKSNFQLFLALLSALDIIKLIFVIINISLGTVFIEEFLNSDCFRCVPIVFVWLLTFEILSPGPVITILITHDISFAVVNLFQHSAINGRVYTVIN